MISPLISSVGGGPQLIAAEVGESETALKFSGEALGAELIT